MIRLSICIVAQNEEHNLARLLRSVQSIADEIVVVDGGSTDGTVGIAKGSVANFSSVPSVAMPIKKTLPLPWPVTPGFFYLTLTKS